MKVCVQGLWHLGSVTAAALASVGHEVTGLDADASVVAGLAAGKAPLFEPGLDELIRAGISEGRLRFIANVAAVPADMELLWVAADTPVNADDEADVEAVMRAVVGTLPYLAPGTTVLVSSQLPVGSIARLEAEAARLCPHSGLGFACSPENLRLGKALEVFLKPDRVVVGVRRAVDKERIGRLLEPITDRIEWMAVESAEMTKHAINAFLATSVVFANELAAICEQVGADAKEVERGLKTESRIGPRAYLGPGAAFAGGTLARDVEYLKAESTRAALTSPLLYAIRASNDAHKAWAVRTLEEMLGGLPGRTVAVWGLTYKPGTSTLRRSLAVELCERLLAGGARLAVHDPQAEALPNHWQGRVARYAQAAQAVAGSDALVVATEWPEYRALSPVELRLAPGYPVIDANRFLGDWARGGGILYCAVGSRRSQGAV